MESGRKILIVVFSCLLSSAIVHVLAQEDSIYLETIEIISNRLPQGQNSSLPGLQVQKWELASLSAEGKSSLSGLLQGESGVHFKHYGPASSSTTSIRGASAAQSGILWNGFQIHNPMLGQADFSLVPIASSDIMFLSTGGQSALWGSGMIGGLISLHNLPSFQIEPTFILNAGQGSYGHWNILGKLSFGNNHFSGSTRLLVEGAKNDFPIRSSGQNERDQTNAKLENRAIFQDLHWKLTVDQLIGLHFWKQKYQRQIPPTSTQNRSEASQEDDLLRVALQWQKKGNKVHWQSRIGFFSESMLYTDPMQLIETDSRFHKYSAEVLANSKWLKNGRWEIGMRSEVQQGETQAYGDKVQQFSCSVFSSFKKNSQLLDVLLAARAEVTEHARVEPTGMLGIDWHCSSTLTASVALSRNFRNPSLNDRYWIPGGNPDLLPESSWGEELGLSFKKDFAAVESSISSTVYHRQIHDFILWTPSSQASFWSPSNVGNVRTYGLEQRVRFSKRVMQMEWNLKVGYDWVRSYSKQNIELPIIEKNRQLFYIPEHKIFFTLRYRRQKMTYEYQHQWTGRQSTFSEPLPSFDLGALGLYYRLQKDPNMFRIYFRLENLWNEEYRLIERRPMPGRNYRVGFELRLVPDKVKKK